MATQTTKYPQYCIWQWNCRGLRKKRSNLQFYLGTHQTPPNILALQETGGKAKLASCRAFIDLNATSKTATVTTLVGRNLPTLQHDTEEKTIEHVLLEISLHQNDMKPVCWS